MATTGCACWTARDVTGLLAAGATVARHRCLDSVAVGRNNDGPRGRPRRRHERAELARPRVADVAGLRAGPGIRGQRVPRLLEPGVHAAGRVRSRLEGNRPDQPAARLETRGRALPAERRSVARDRLSEPATITRRPTSQASSNSRRTLRSLVAARRTRRRQAGHVDQRLRRTENQLRHFERMASFPDGFVVLGDAASAFNPVYGQGMSVAGLSGLVLQQWLRRRRDVRDLPRSVSPGPFRRPGCSRPARTSAFPRPREADLASR